MYAPTLGIPVTKAPETPGWDVSKARDPGLTEEKQCAKACTMQMVVFLCPLKEELLHRGTHIF